jgi:hypothetical protein
MYLPLINDAATECITADRKSVGICVPDWHFPLVL